MGSKETITTKGAKWNICTAENVVQFSAVATYFEKFLQKEIIVPIGIILSAWGGTDIEPWISARTLGQLGKHHPKLKQLSAIDDMEEFSRKIAVAQKAWDDSLIL